MAFKNIFLLLLLGIFSPILHAQSAEEIPSKAHQIQIQKARFTALTAGFIRMEWSPAGNFEDRASFIFTQRDSTQTQFCTAFHGDTLILRTPQIELKYLPDQEPFSPHNLTLTYMGNNTNFYWFPGKKNNGNLKGTTRTLDGFDGSPIELENGLLSTDGWTLIDDSKSFLLDNSPWPWVSTRTDTSSIDWYFLAYGNNYKQALFDFTQAAGSIPLPPRYAFGYWWSRYWIYADKELRHLTREMQNNNIPMDVLVIDMDWHKTYGLNGRNFKRDPFGEWLGWTGYSWNRTLFPDPARFLEWTDQQPLKTALNLHPASGIAPMEDCYKNFRKAYQFEGKEQAWIPYAMSEKKWARAYFETITKPLEDMGIDFWWLDWQQFMESRITPGLSNTWWLNYTFSTRPNRHPDQRPLIFHRWGGLGNHRYQIGFSGDTQISWRALAYLPYFTATASNVCYGYWSHDIGGHIPLEEQTNPELYLRWLQYGVFSPILRTHSTKSAAIERRFWKFPHHADAMMASIRQRYQLAPYIYHSAWQAHQTGVSICRPLYYELPENPKAYTHPDEYYFGDQLLIHPITVPADTITGLCQIETWLPKGEWYNWSTTSLLAGDTSIKRAYTLNEYPVFVKAGSILPLYTNRKNLQDPIHKLVLELIPGGPDSTQFSLYEDDGKSESYLQATHSRFPFSCYKNPHQLHFIIHPAQGRYAEQPETRAYQIRIPLCLPPKSITLNGQPLHLSPSDQTPYWHYEAEKLQVSIQLPPQPISSLQSLQVVFDTAISTHKLSGLPAFFKRLEQAVERLKFEVARSDWAGTIPDLLNEMDQCVSRINYNPETAVSALNNFLQLRPLLYETIYKLEGVSPTVIDKTLELLNNRLPPLPKPQIRCSKTESAQVETLEISGNPGAQIHYTLDGSTPSQTSPLYSSPVKLSHTAQIQARQFAPNHLGSRPATATFARLQAKAITYVLPPANTYQGGSINALINGLKGDADNIKQHWVGFEGEDANFTIELSKPINHPTITARFLQNMHSWILAPKQVKIAVSTGGNQFTEIFCSELAKESLHRSLIHQVIEYTIKCKLKNIQFIRVQGINSGTLPAWHSGAGHKSWIFTDELEVQ